MRCRICQYKSEFVISFGKMPLANHFLKKEDFDEEYFFELATMFCDRCKTFQLIEQPKPDKMFHDNYAFFSGTSKKMEAHFEHLAKYYQEKFITKPSESFVVELGSNDGIMLKHFSKKGIDHIGIEPSLNVAEVARQQGVNTISKFFDENLAKELYLRKGQADIISASNVMCHIPDLKSVAAGIKLLLKPNGVFVFEDPYLGDMIEKVSFDQIYDEHVYLFSANAVSNIFLPYGLELFNVERQTTHGGSMRYYLGHRAAHAREESVDSLFLYEKDKNLDIVETFYNFSKNCVKKKKNLIHMLSELKEKNKRVVGYAATSKSTTVLNYCDIGPDLVEYISDTTPIKQGKFSPGMHIPVVPYERFKRDDPDYAILFAWNHETEIFEKEEDFLKRGGHWIKFVPNVEVLEQKSCASLPSD